MKRNAGAMLLLAILFAGTRLPTHPTQTSSAANQAGASNSQRQVATLENSNCPAFNDSASIKDSSSDGKITSMVQRYLYGPSPDPKVVASQIPADIRFLVATVPDPLHTHLSLQFDRTLEALQQALQDEGYTYDSSWLPWKTQSATYQNLQDEKEEAKETSHRELCPGLILFRRSMNAHKTDQSPPCELSEAGQLGEPYKCGIFVFLVAETPTSGLNQIQWHNAQAWMDLHARRDRPDLALRILGPTFSGSMPSIVRALASLGTNGSSFKSVLLYTGRIRGCSSWKWLKRQLNGAKQLPVRTSDFVENDAVVIDRFYRFLQDRGHALSEVAILSEDETAYGGLPDPLRGTMKDGSLADDSQSTCETLYQPPDQPMQASSQPVHLYYPRDISAVRSAYQEQSIFSNQAATETSEPTHTVLQPRYQQTPHAELDTIEPFSGQGVALTQEAQLYGIVNSLRAHGIRFVILRSTNSLDYLFLARFIHRAYPDAYLVTMGTDMLFGREVDSTEFRGVLALSAFPLLPRGQDWTMQTSSAKLMPQHAHRVFGSDIMEGVYLATRFLATDCDVSEESGSCGKENIDHFIHPPKPDLPDYAEPFWEYEPQQLSASTWVSVVGRQGYWPVTVLKKPYYEHPILFSNLTQVQRPKEMSTSAVRTAKGWFSLSSAWKFLCFLSVLLICAHWIACWWGWKRADLSIFIQFTPLPGNRQFAIRAIGWAIVCSTMVELFLASARMYDWLRWTDQFWVWLTGGCALAGCIAALFDTGFVRERTPPTDPGSSAYRSTKSKLWIALMLGIVSVAVLVGTQIFDYSNSSGVATAYRSVHITSGVSPMVSLLLVLAGLYWWIWQALAGLSLLGPGRPTLPQLIGQSVSLCRVSCDMAEGIEAAAIPFPRWEGLYKWLYLLPLLLLALLACVLQRPWTIGFDAILHSLESESFNWTLHGLFAIGLFLLILDCSQLLLTWSSLKRLLLALNRLPLRRTFAAFQGLSMQSLWSMSGTSSRMRYTVFSHQLESLVHLRNELDSFESRDSGTAAVRFAIRRAVVLALGFIETRSQGPDLAMANDSAAREVRGDFSRCTEEIIKDLLIPEWFSDRTSLDLKVASSDDKLKEDLPLSDNRAIRLAEEFVCLIYVGYLQNMLARMRTMVLSMAGVFVTIALSVAFYPYTPRPLLSLSLLLTLLVLGSAVAFVYAGLDRDTTMSHITNTEPGRLGVNFWMRILSFGGIPALGLLVAQFPEIADFVGSWIQPGVNAVK
jgi:hypothetical protein